jgi:glycosyltransferase involved in cell wall biosynthesis
LHTIPNGLDTEEFVPNSTAPAELRRELKVNPDTELVGYIARWDPQKDHAMFFSAAGRLAKVRPNVHFVLCGAGMDASNAELGRHVANANLGGRLHLLGLRSDVPYVTAGLNVASCCSSYGESFALVLGEAMSCGIPVVSTGLPGPASVVGDEGWIVPIGNPSAMALGWQAALEMTAEERDERGKRARRRIVETFSIQKMVDRYEALYMEVAAGARLDSATKTGVISSTSR